MVITHAPSRTRPSGAGPGPYGRVLRAGRRVRTVGVLAVGAVLVAQLTVPTPLDRVALPLAVVGILLGVPHGAVDHLVPFWSAGRRVDAAALARVLAGYLLVLALALAAVLLYPVAALGVFLLVSALHFGRGEVVVAAELDGRRPPELTHDVLPALAHGAVTVGLPLAAWTSVSLPLLDRVAPGFASTPPGALRALLVGCLVLVVLAVVVLLHAGRRREVAELLLLTVTFLVVPPYAAFGVYFGLWHAARHTVRLVALPLPGGAVDLRAGLRRYLYGAALPTAGALALLLAVWRTDSSSLLAAQLATLVALTAPHVIVVGGLDRQAAARA